MTDAAELRERERRARARLSKKPHRYDQIHSVSTAAILHLPPERNSRGGSAPGRLATLFRLFIPFLLKRIPHNLQSNWQISGDMATEHVNGNGTEEPMDNPAVTHSEHFQTLLEAGLPQKVAEKLDEIYIAGLVAHSDLDERAIEALKEFNEEGALQVLQQFKDSDLSHVQNKSAFLCGVMKTYRQREKHGTKVSESSKGPDEAKIKELLERTSYTLDVTTGQRKYGGPPPECVHSGMQPTVGTEIFVGKIPRDLFEDELVPLFEKAGPIWDLRLMMDPLSGLNRGYAFVTFCTKEAAQEAVKLCNNHEIRPGKHIGVCISVANNRLFVGSIPKSKTKEQIIEEFGKVTEGLTDVILYHQPDDKKKNRGFCFLEYEDHKTAAQARRRLISGKVKVWGNVVTVEWADPIEDPDPEVMAKVKVLFVRNLASTVTEEILEKTFGQYGKLERVKKLKDYAFIHFDERDGAVKALDQMNGKDLEGERIQIVFAKPPDQKRKERKAQRQAAKTQMYDDYYYYGPPHMPPPTRGRGRGGGRGGYAYPPDYYAYEDYDYYYGYDYHNYRGGYEDPYYGYEDFQGAGRGRGGRGSRGSSLARGRGAGAPRGRVGFSPRGGPGSARGARGTRGGPQQRGRGGKGVEAGPDLLL
ncbi:heterogeneous nuclear ribonucleoprotein Q isoform X8 [Acipenser ruthenus]|uniref:heterogeneous nuclear ribonucleoprotein Q isoform X8 n=1 Tax=Acipenser ruthenus TaxID=7906 RepID=UPI00145A7D9C|nr:heterogeneous nuclear ribonucleoprotein Q isoform X8 [Acipenser ruthenus]